MHIAYNSVRYAGKLLTSGEKKKEKNTWLFKNPCTNKTLAVKRKKFCHSP